MSFSLKVLTTNNVVIVTRIASYSLQVFNEFLKLIDLLGQNTILPTDLHVRPIFSYFPAHYLRI